MRTSFTIPSEPVGKPRQTRSDRWKKRPEVERYRAWCDEARLAATGSPLKQIAGETVLAIYAFFHFPLPESWSAKKKAQHYGRLHQAKPDTDNCLKATVDSLFGEDKTIAVMHGVKLWCEEGESGHTDVFLLIPTDPPPTASGSRRRAAGGPCPPTGS